MNTEQNSTDIYISYHAWDRMVRVFHWLNVACVIALIGIGIVVLNTKILGVSTDGKILLKTVHVYVGYIFVLNLACRIVWGFTGGRFAKWNYVFRFDAEYFSLLREYIQGLVKGCNDNYLGHNPLARIMVVVLFLLLALQGITGLVLAGTDLYMPPFGQKIAEWVTHANGDQERIDNLKPYAKSGYDEQRYEQMRKYRKPFITVHYYSFYILVIGIFLHVLGIIFSEFREKCGLTSAMITGRKMFDKEPIDIKPS